MNEALIQVTIQTTIEEIIKNSNLFQFDIANLIISILAIGISIWSVYSTSKKSAQANYRKDLYDNMLRQLLQDKMPEIVNKSFDLKSETVNKIEVDKLEELIGKIRNKLLVFKYIDKVFYEKMEKTLVDLDEKIVIISTRSENFKEKHENILKDIDCLYKIIEKHLFK